MVLNPIFKATLAVTCFALAITVSDTSFAGAKKDRNQMQQAALDIVGVCMNVVVSNQTLGKATSGRSFENSKHDMMGSLKFKEVFRKFYGKGLSKTHLAIAISESGECVSKVESNYESETLWNGVDQRIKQYGYSETQKPIIASRMYVSGYKRGSRTIVASGRSGRAQSLTVISKK